MQVPLVPPRLETLPSHIRIKIFRYAIYPACPYTLICCWESPIQMSFISNILSHSHNGTNYNSYSYPENVHQYISDYGNLSLVNNLFNSEVAPLFYADHTFRVNTEQLAVLLTKRHILSKLHRLEVENVEVENVRPYHRAYWPGPIVKLAKSPSIENIDRIVLGANCCGKRFPTIDSMLAREIHRIHNEREATRDDADRASATNALIILSNQCTRQEFPRRKPISGLSYSQHPCYKGCADSVTMYGREFLITDLVVRAIYGC